MLPAEKPRTSGATFPYIGLAVAVLALYAILAVVSPPSAIRSVVAIAAFFAMGYCALALIAGNRLPMSPAEILAFTVALTIILTSVSSAAAVLREPRAEEPHRHRPGERNVWDLYAPDSSRPDERKGQRHLRSGPGRPGVALRRDGPGQRIGGLRRVHGVDLPPLGRYLDADLFDPRGRGERHLLPDV